MKITEIIAELENIKARYDDLDVEVRNEIGDFNFAEAVEIVKIPTKEGTPKFRAYLDT